MIEVKKPSIQEQRLKEEINGFKHSFYNEGGN